ncbi:hypothetical protein GCM10017771_30180 [Streptomyces capitiformicae]|uniref:Uncharacterized protein n=1 Tax=Streptomyces capitiformicae TaxID=2014920 RepID=A0A919GNI4_9ACTN|nr:hypothetical protein GCM10017771_30180 [Streptomyces capitiformicae]
MGEKGDAPNGEPLVGGTVNAGRSSGGVPWSTARRRVPRPALHTRLRALRHHGFEGGPLPVRLTSDGREQLTFVPGEVVLPPFPSWALTEPALASVGKLLRRLCPDRLRPRGTGPPPLGRRLADS